MYQVCFLLPYTAVSRDSYDGLHTGFEVGGEPGVGQDVLQNEGQHILTEVEVVTGVGQCGLHTEGLDELTGGEWTHQPVQAEVEG